MMDAQTAALQSRLYAALATTLAWLSFVVAAILWLAASLLPLRSRRGG